MAGDAQKCYDWCNFIMNNFEVQSKFIAKIIWADEECFSRNTKHNKQNLHFWLWIILDILLVATTLVNKYQAPNV